MPDPDWRQSIVEYIPAEARPVDKFGHQPRLYALACRVGKGLKFDDDVLFAAAWMHDLGVFVGHRAADPAEFACWDHVPYTIARTRELLLVWGFPPAKFGAVASVEIEAVILRDADIIEQLGAVGALRAISKVGRDPRYPTFSAIVPVLQRAADDLPPLLRLRSARLLAAKRVKHLKALLAAIQAEAGQLLHWAGYRVPRGSPDPAASLRRVLW
jgi:uncharacterized protein